MITTHSIITYREPIGSFMFNYVLNFSIETLMTFWLPCLLFFSLIVIGLFRPKRHLLSLRRCVILLGSVCALWGLHFASGVLFIFIRIEPAHYDDCMIWGIGIGYMIRGCILLILAAILVFQNLLFIRGPEDRNQGPLVGDKEEEVGSP
ncbi:MAG: hypothetical protein ILO10_08060 [Kiritimatiellae bacterium]|nr:hypothetical protein [Kiritimatiellia bacterium]